MDFQITLIPSVAGRVTSEVWSDAPLPDGKYNRVVSAPGYPQKGHVVLVAPVPDDGNVVQTSVIGQLAIVDPGDPDVWASVIDDLELTDGQLFAWSWGRIGNGPPPLITIDPGFATTGRVIILFDYRNTGLWLLTVTRGLHGTLALPIYVRLDT